MMTDVVEDHRSMMNGDFRMIEGDDNSMTYTIVSILPVEVEVHKTKRKGIISVDPLQRPYL